MKNIKMLINLNWDQLILIMKYRIHMRYVILTYSATILAG
jgi:hypothetical protein